MNAVIGEEGVDTVMVAIDLFEKMPQTVVQVPTDAATVGDLKCAVSQTLGISRSC